MYPGRCVHHFLLLIENSDFLKPSKLLLDKAVDNVTNVILFYEQEWSTNLALAREFIQDYVDA